VNWDVAIDTHRKCLGCRIIVWDHKGFVIAAQSKRLNVLQEPVVAEAMVALVVVEFSQNLGHNS
jgi:hypothetical protein